MFNSLCRTDDESTLRCHAQISRSAYCGTAATKITSGLIFLLIGWDLGQRMLIRHSLCILPYTMYAKAQCPIEEHMVLAPLRRPLSGMLHLWYTKPTIFSNLGEVWHEMNK